MKAGTQSKICTFLWYEKEAAEAAAFYCSIFPDSRVDRVTKLMTEIVVSRYVGVIRFSAGDEWIGGRGLASCRS